MLSTTQLLVEHIISGLLAMIGIGISLLILLDTGAEDLIAPLLDNWSVATLFIGAIAYPTGLIVDEVNYLKCFELRLMKIQTKPTLAI